MWSKMVPNVFRKVKIPFGVIVDLGKTLSTFQTHIGVSMSRIYMRDENLISCFVHVISSHCPSVTHASFCQILILCKNQICDSHRKSFARTCARSISRTRLRRLIHGTEYSPLSRVRAFGAAKVARASIRARNRGFGKN